MKLKNERDSFVVFCLVLFIFKKKKKKKEELTVSWQSAEYVLFDQLLSSANFRLDKSKPTLQIALCSSQMPASPPLERLCLL